MAPPPTPEGRAERLTVSILTRDSANRIAGRIAEALTFADEVIVGVDAASNDDTFEIASAAAHVAYRFRHDGRLAPARLLPFEFASGDWILSLDDDESIEQVFDLLKPELLSAAAVTHYYFPRKWIVNLDPCEYLRTAPWFPDWQLRLFRNDAASVWKPPQAHSGYRVQGLGYHEPRASILHFEPLWCAAQARRTKMETYRQAGGPESAEACYQSTMALGPESRATCALREDTPRVRITLTTPRVELTARQLQTAEFPDWRGSLSVVEMPNHVTCGDTVIAEIRGRNTGSMAWSVHTGRWPSLNLAFHLLDTEGRTILFDGPRFPMPRLTRPGDYTLFLVTFSAPSQVGDYVLEWDLVSEGECWFQDSGSEVLRTPLRVSARTEATDYRRPPFPFVVGAPRSGTTLLRMMLDSHSQMAIPSGTHFFFDLAQHSGPALDAEAFVRLLTTHFTWPDFHITTFDFRAALDALPSFNLADALRTFYRLYAARFEKPRFGEKTPDYGEIVPAIETLLPEAHFLHLIRDGRDVAVSKRSLWFGAGQDISAQAAAWAEQVRRTREAARHCRHYLEIHYEELVRTPREILLRVCQFLDLPFEEGMLRYYERAADRLQEVNDWPSQGVTAEQRRALHALVQRPPLTERIGRWKQELTETEIAAFEAVAGECLRELGYETANILKS